MVRPFFSVLGVLILTSWTTATYAQSSPQARNEGVTLSGDSLQGIRSRTLSEEYPNLIIRTGTSSNSQTSTDNAQTSVETNNPIPTTVDVNGREVGVAVSGPDGRNPNTNPIFLNNSERNDEVKFQLQLNQ